MNLTGTFAKVKDHLVNWRQWEANPVVVKELRQSVRSWAVVGMLLLFLTVLFCTSLTFLIGQSLDINGDTRLGGTIFQTFAVILTVASMAFIPLYVGIRLAAERQESNLDLLYITTLTPERIIRGKFFCGAYMTVLFFSACMPFMVFSNLLRGVDLPTVFFILICLFLIVCVTIQVAIFLACLPLSRAFKVLVAMFGALGVFSVIPGLTFLVIQMMRSGVGSMLMSGSRFWAGFGTTAGMILIAFMLLYYLSVALISPMSANRALPLRIYVTSIWLLGAGVSFVWAVKEHEARLVLPWAVISLLLLAGALIVVVSNHDDLSLRVRRRIPMRPSTRAFAFLFYNGAAGGLVWLVLLAGLTCGISMGFLRLSPRWFGSSTLTGESLANFEIATSVTVMYALAYGLTALCIHRRYFGHRSPRLAGIMAILLPGAWALLPTLALFFMNRLTIRSVDNLQLGNIFNVFNLREVHEQSKHLICAGIWLVVMAALNARWFLRQVDRFRPPDSSLATANPAKVSVPPPLPNEAESLKG